MTRITLLALSALTLAYVLPAEVTITGQWIIDQRDPLTHGFQLRNESRTSQ